MKAPAGWYLDPDRDDLSRYWDGSQWSNHRQTPEHDTGPIEAYVEVAEPRDVADAHDPTTGSDIARRVPGHALLAKLAELSSNDTLTDHDTAGRVLSPQALGAYHAWLGERAVAAELAALGDEWTVLHSVPIGRGASDLDHVVIGPPGVVVISTKRHPGESAWINDRTMMIEGSRVAYLTNCAHEARQVTTLLTNQVGFTAAASAVLALVGAAHLTERRRPGFSDVAVHATDARHLVGLITSLPSRHTPKQVAELADAARRPQTWRASPRTEFGVEELQRRLVSPKRGERLYEPQALARRRRWWTIGAAGVVAVALAALASANAASIGTWIGDAVSSLLG